MLSEIEVMMGELSIAINKRNLCKVKELLRQVHLLNQMTVVDIGNNLINISSNNFISLLAREKNPEIIFELIFAGFPVPLLAHIFCVARNNFGLQVLFRLLPQLSGKEQTLINDPEEMQLDICVLNYGIPNIPVRVDRTIADFELLMKVLRDSKYVVNFGNLNTLLIDQLDTVTLDLKYLATVRDFFTNKYDYTANSDIDNIQLRNQLIMLMQSSSLDKVDIDYLSNIVLKDFGNGFASRFFKGIHRTSFRKIIIVLLINSLLVSFGVTNNIKTIATEYVNEIDSEFVKQMVRQFNNLALLVILVTAYSLFILNRLINDPKKIHTLQNMHSALLRIWLSSESLTKIWDLKKSFEFTTEKASEIRSFDFIKAQQTLPGIIAERFHKEYAEDKYPGLFFWKQAFEQRDKLTTAEQHLDNEITNKSALQLAM